MGSPQRPEVAGLGIDFYKWVLGTLSFSRGRGGYRRLNPPVRKRVKLARLGKTRRLRAFTKRRLPRLRLSWFSPFALLAKLRDSYVHLLQAASNKFAFSEGLAFGPYPALPFDGSSSVPFGDFKAKDRELNMLLQLYLARTSTRLILAPADDDRPPHLVESHEV